MITADAKAEDAFAGETVIALFKQPVAVPSTFESTIVLSIKVVPLYTVFNVVVSEVSQAVADADPCPNSTTSAVPLEPVIVTFAASTKPTSGIGEIAAKIKKSFLPFFLFLVAPPIVPRGVKLDLGLIATSRLLVSV